MLARRARQGSQECPKGGRRVPGRFHWRKGRTLVGLASIGTLIVELPMTHEPFSASAGSGLRVQGILNSFHEGFVPFMLQAAGAAVNRSCACTWFAATMPDFLIQGEYPVYQGVWQPGNVVRKGAALPQRTRSRAWPWAVPAQIHEPFRRSEPHLPAFRSCSSDHLTGS